MTFLYQELEEKLSQYIRSTYPEVEIGKFTFQPTNKEHEGDLTLMVFPLTKFIKKNPELLAKELGEVLLASEFIEAYTVIKGFLNLLFSNLAWNHLASHLENLGYRTEKADDIVLEYCGPNTNKPLHIGHLRNVFLGFAVGKILEEVGHTVHKVNINNDRGIAICKSMIAYHLYGNGETPESTGMKGDFLVGKYYVKYNDILKTESVKLQEEGINPEDADQAAPIAVAAQEMLLKWENGDQETIALWNLMNSWFYDGMHQTLNLLEIDFEKEYYESQEYKKGKDIVDLGFNKGVFQKDDTGAIYIDLTDKGLDKKYLQRANGTSIYITQDMALVKKRYEDFKMDRMIYTVGDEQNYHFKVLGYIMEAMKEPFSKNIYHLSYGMVTGKDGSKFKSREGTTADADAIIADVILEAKNQTLQSGKAIQLEKGFIEELSKILGIGAIKFAMLRVNPKKSIPFDPKEAVDLHGDTGTFIQYSYVRTKAILTKFDQEVSKPKFKNYQFNFEEKAIIEHLFTFSSHLRKAEENYDPSEVCHYVLQLAKLFNRFYTQHSILNHENEEIKSYRIYLTSLVSNSLEKSLNLLGITAPERM